MLTWASVTTLFVALCAGSVVPEDEGHWSGSGRVDADWSTRRSSRLKNVL